MGTTRFTRTLLLLDAGTCLATGLLLTLTTALLSDLLGLPAWLLAEAGLILFPSALFALWAGRRTGLSTIPAWIMVGLNLCWVLGSVTLLASGWVTPTPIGTLFVLVQAAAVTGIAGVQTYSLRSVAVPI